MSMDPGTTTGPLPDPIAVKPGLQTSEFWTALGTAIATTVVAVLALFGKHIDGTTLQPLIGAAAILGPIIVSAAYSLSRGNVKAAAHAAGGALQAVTLAAQPALAAAPAVDVAAPAAVAAPAPVAAEPVQEDPPMAEDDGLDH